jgi:hypothetical protein
VTRAAARAGRLDAFHVGIAVATVLAIVATAPVWGAQLLPGNDVTGHLVRTRAGLELLRDGRLDGWDPSFGLGNQQWLFYGPGFTWAVAVLRAITVGTLSDAGALKVLAVASFVAIPAAAAFLADSLELGRAEAGFAAITSILASNPFGVGLEGLFDLGLVPQQLAAVLFLVVLGAVVRVLRAPTRRLCGVATLALTALVLTHLISVVLLGLMLVLLVPAVLLHDGKGVRALGPVAAIGLLSAALSAFWLIPLAAHRNLHGPVATWPTPSFGERLADVLQGNILFVPAAATAVALGLAWGFTRVGQGRVYAGIVAAGPLVVLAVAHWAHHGWRNELSFQLANRGLGLIGIMLTFPLAAGLAYLAARLQDWMEGGRIAVLIVAALLAANTVSSHGDLVRAEPEPTVAAAHAAAELRRLVPEPARFVTMRNLENERSTTGVAQPDRWLAWKSERNTLNVFPLELSSVSVIASEIDALGQKAPVESAAALRRYGVTHVVTLTSADAAVLSAAPAFRRVWSEGSLTILSLDPRDGQPRPSALVTADVPASARLVDGGSQRLVLDIHVQAPATATIAVAWSPKWRAEIDGRRVATHRSPEGLLTVDVPAGVPRLELRFGSDGWDLAGRSASLLALLLFAAAAFLSRRRRNRTTSDTRSGSRRQTD